MKWTIFESMARLRRLILGLLVGCSAPAASLTGASPLPEVPMRGANTVVVHTADAPEPALRTLAALLVAHGFGVERSGPGFVLTAPRQVPGQRPGWSWQVMAGVGDMAGTTHRRVPTRLLLSSFGSGHAALVGKANDPRRQAFALLRGVAEAYPGGRVEYQRNQ